MGVSLPEDYVRFITEVANGGYPPCRLVPLEEWSRAFWIEEEESRRWLQSECRISPETQESGEHWLDKTFGSDWEKKFDENEIDPLFGTICVAEIGCGLFFSLIVNGPNGGKVFSYGDHLLNPPRFVDQPDFGTWIRSCLEIASLKEPIHFLNGLTPEIPTASFWRRYY
jgi:hypothetical protein